MTWLTFWTDREEFQNDDGDEMGGIAWVAAVCHNRGRSLSYGISRHTSRSSGPVRYPGP